MFTKLTMYLYLNNINKCMYTYDILINTKNNMILKLILIMFLFTKDINILLISMI